MNFLIATNKNKIYYNKRTNYILFSKNPKEDYDMFNRSFKEIFYENLVKEDILNF